MKDDRRILLKIIEHCNGIEEAVQYFGKDGEDFIGNKISKKAVFLIFFRSEKL